MTTDAEKDPRLFYDSYLAALRDDVDACGGTKTVGEWFWPEKSHDARRNMVNDRLSEAKRDRFSDEQERLVMRRARERRGFSAALCFICDDTGFERALKSRNQGDEAAELQRAFIDSVQQQARILERLERLPPVLALVKGAGAA